DEREQLIVGAGEHRSGFVARERFARNGLLREILPDHRADTSTSPKSYLENLLLIRDHSPGLSPPSPGAVCACGRFTPDDSTTGAGGGGESGSGSGASITTSVGGSGGPDERHCLMSSSSLAKSPRKSCRMNS